LYPTKKSGYDWIRFRILIRNNVNRQTVDSVSTYIKTQETIFPLQLISDLDRYCKSPILFKLVFFFIPTNYNFLLQTNTVYKGEFFLTLYRRYKVWKLLSIDHVYSLASCLCFPPVALFSHGFVIRLAGL
jgi:hypothetical protein